MSEPKIYSMPSGIAFLPALAKGLRAALGERLEDALILLPTRRAVRQLGEAFVEGRGASLLPNIRTLADIDPEEPPFEPGYLTGLVKPPMPGAQRRFEMARLIAGYHAKITDLPLDPAGMLALTDPLLAILDDAALEEVSLSDLDKLDELHEFAAKHFQNAAILYKIIQEYWPTYVDEKGQMEPMARRVALLNALTNLWTERPPEHPVIIAGSTGTLNASAKLMRCVAHMKDGMIVLPGLDKSMPEEAWTDVTEEHPQNSLKNLIETIGIDRADVAYWPGAYDAASPLHARRRFISESLVPVSATADWPGRIKRLRASESEEDIFETALEGLSVIEARTSEEEALSVALIMRETLSVEDQTAALVTPDPALARRVKARLRRWNVDVDYTQGEPLEETQLGSFLAGILGLAQDSENPVDLAFTYKHHLTALGMTLGEPAKEWRKLEISSFRGARPKALPESEVLTLLQNAVRPLTQIDMADAPSWAQALILAAETIAASDEQNGAERIWREDAGEKAAAMLEELSLYGASLGEMTLPQFARLLGSLMRGKVVRPRYGTHPRLQILGPLEARMLEADRIILGGLNEGVWPAGLSAAPFLSRGMRKRLGLSLPERRYGLAAHDFAELASHEEVVLTRAIRGDDGPKVASRWLWRLQALVRGAVGEDSDILKTESPYLEWARAVDYVEADKVEPATPPTPTPDKDARWPKDHKSRTRHLSVTQVKTLIRDPYSIYAKRILALEPLAGLDEALGAKEYGSAIHKGLENFAKKYSGKVPKDGPRQLQICFEAALLEAGFPEHHLVKEKPRLANTAEFLSEWMAQRRAGGWEFGRAENYGKVHLEECNFTLSAIADLIEKNAEGYAVIDYKTGAPASENVVQAGFDPQLPLTALMLERGGFDNVPAGPTAELLYMRVKGSGHDSEVKVIASPERLKGWSAEKYKNESLEAFTKLIAHFDDPETPYLSQPRIQYVNDYGDYDDLARRPEWARLGNETQGKS